MKYQALSVFYPQATRPYRWMKYLTRISYCWGRVESQWGDFPQWLKPAPVRRLEQCRKQPRFMMPMLAPTTASIGDVAKPSAAMLSAATTASKAAA